MYNIAYDIFSVLFWFNYNIHLYIAPGHCIWLRISESQSLYKLIDTLKSTVCIKRHHYNGVILSAMVSQIAGVSIVCSIVCSGADQRKQQSSASLAFVWEIHKWPVVSPQKGSVTRKMFPFNLFVSLLSNFWHSFFHLHLLYQPYVCSLTLHLPGCSAWIPTFSCLSIILRMKHKIEVPPT